MADLADAAGETGRAVLDHAMVRVVAPVEPLGATPDAEQLAQQLDGSITGAGLGEREALRLFTEVIEPACLRVDHPRFLSFVPAAPTRTALLGDVLTSAARIYGGSWMEGAGAIQAENDVLRWIAGFCGLPDTAGGVFVPGGTNGNTSALIAARHRWRTLGSPGPRSGGMVIASQSVHPSVPQAAKAMDAELVLLPGDTAGRLDRRSLEAVQRALGEDRHRVFAVCATAGTTNAGIIDDLEAAADTASELGCWLHVDGAYGLAAACSDRHRHLFSGVERADSLIVDPHKWLFGPFDSCALLYRDPPLAREAHQQRAPYLEVLNGNSEGSADWNPSDYALHLSRRPRGLPTWFSLVSLGTKAYADAIDATMSLAAEAAELIGSSDHLQLLLEPELSTVVFRRRGWNRDAHSNWSRKTLANGTAVVLPTTWNGEVALRICIVNPRTTIEDIEALVDSLL